MQKFRIANDISSSLTGASVVGVKAYGYIVGILFAIVLNLFLCNSALAQIAQFSQQKPITVQGDVAFTYQQGKKEIWIIRNNCQILESGRPAAEAAEMTLWLEYDQRPVAGSSAGS